MLLVPGVSVGNFPLPASLVIVVVCTALKGVVANSKA